MWLTRSSSTTTISGSLLHPRESGPGKAGEAVKPADALCVQGGATWYPICGYSGVLRNTGVAGPSNFPGSHDGSGAWTDANGNFWLMGGQAVDKNGYIAPDSGGNISTLNDPVDLQFANKTVDVDQRLRRCTEC